MRFKFKILNIGDQRYIYKFAWLPIKINNEIRWLEKVFINQTYSFSEKWVNVKFIDSIKEFKIEE